MRAAPARFYPGRLSETELEARFVSRGPLLDVLVADLAATVREGGARYVLVVGAEGSGKTHLVELLRHRLHHDTSFTERSTVVWMGEENPVASLQDLFHRATIVLGGEGRFGDDEAALRAFSELVGRRRLVFLVERLDRLFASIGHSGQSKLRGALENHRGWSLVGTARAVGDAFTDRKSPFYQTFVRHQLRDLSALECRALLDRLATRGGDDALREALQGARGLARVRAMRHLVGGTPRAMTLLAPWLDAATLDDPTPALLAVADELAPVLSGHLDALPEGQRVLLEHLATAWRPRSVGELAEATFQTHQSTSTHLRRLGPLLQVAPAGRERCYEVADPLLALVRGAARPELGAFARFLVAWYEPEPRVRWRERLPEPTSTEPAVLAALEGGALEGATGAATEAVLALLRGEDPVVPEGPILLENWLNELSIRRTPEVVSRIGEMVGLARLSPEDRIAWLHALRTSGDPDRAALHVDAALRGVREARQASVLRIRAMLAAGRSDEALASAERAVAKWPAEAVWREWAAAAANTLGQAARAEAHAAEAVRVDPGSGRAWYVLGVARSTLGRFAGAATALHRARALLPRAEDPARFLLFGALIGSARFDEAAALVPALDAPDQPWARTLIASAGGDLASIPPLPGPGARRYRSWLHPWLGWLAEQARLSDRSAAEILRAMVPAPVDDELRAALAVGLGRLAAAWVPELPRAFRAFFDEADAVIGLGAFEPILDALAGLPGSGRKIARLAAPERAILADLLTTHGKEGLLG